jgi:peptidoglycan L-alanyl-D-glutamate endopeptidase CwlK
MERQKELWDQGRTQPGPIVTYSQPGLSLHHYGCAVDSCFVGSDPFLAKLKDGQMFWDEFGRIAQGYGLVWGGAWSKGVDRPHCQFTYGHTVQELVEIYKIGGLEGCFKSYDKWMASH